MIRHIRQFSHHSPPPLFIHLYFLISCELTQNSTSICRDCSSSMLMSVALIKWTPVGWGLHRGLFEMAFLQCFSISEHTIGI